MGSAVAAIIGVPALVTALSPVLRRQRAPVWQGIGPVSDFPVGEVQPAVVAVTRDDVATSMHEKGVYVWRAEVDRIIVFSRNCTDLGCPVTHDTGSGWFFCPCHGGIFDHEGQRRAGPPDRPLYRFANRIRDGMLEIDLRSVPPMA
jgi:Rieske Fe-S protein